MDKLNEPVLVLNKGFQAIHIIEARKAVSLLYQDVAEAIGDDYGSYKFKTWCQMSLDNPNEQNYNHLHSTSLTVRIPHVIRLITYERLPIKEVMFNRKNIYARDKYTCQYCGGVFKESFLTFDHVTPRSRGGKNSFTNIVTACKPCNTRKADHTPEEVGMVLLRKPTKPRWRSYVKMPLSKLKEIKMSIWRIFLSKPYWEVDE